MNNPKRPLTKSNRSHSKKTNHSEGLLYDDMEIEENADFDLFNNELDLFINQDITVPTKITAATSKDNGQHVEDDSDEAWINSLLKDDNSPSIPVAPSSSQHEKLSDIFSEDIITAIPKNKVAESPEIIHQKIQARLSNKTPTQEQIIKRRGVGYYFFWGVGSLLMMMLAVVQYAIFNINTIAKNPEYAQLASTICSSCHIPSADPSAFSTTYTLDAGDADFTTDMLAQISNHSKSTQLFPNIKISIQDAEDKIIGELALAPEEYLEVKQSEIQAGQQSRFMLTLDLSPSDIKAITIEPFY